MIFSYISGEALHEKVEFKALLHVNTMPHVDEPPGSPYVADGLA